MPKRASLKDIAEKVGVSTALGSYVMNGKEKEKRVGCDVVLRIKKVASELNYKPNQIAQSLRTGSTKTIGLIVADISNPFFGNLARVIEDEAIRFYGGHDITMKNCCLEGTISCYPQIYYGESNLLDKPNDGNKYIIDNQKNENIRLINVSVTGKSVIKDLESIHDGVAASVSIERDVRSRLVINCDLEYHSALNADEYLSQIETAKEVISGRYKSNEMYIYIKLAWPGITKKIYAYPHTILLGDNCMDVGKVMNDQKQYLSFDQAMDQLKTWIPPLMRFDDMTSVDESLSFKLNNAIITDGTAYYSIDISTDKIDSMLTFNVNAMDGSISMYFDLNAYSRVKIATTDQITAVVNYVKSSAKVIPEDATFRAFIVNDNHVIFSSDFAGFRYILSEDNGVIKAEPYYELDGD